MVTTVALVGASGKLGSVFRRLIDASPEYEMHSALGSSSDLNEMNGADLVVDVTHPGVSHGVVTHATGQGINVLVGTSGWHADRIGMLRNELGDSDVGVVIIPNFSLGSVLGTALAVIAGRFYDSIEIIEAHRSTKVDSPSGTAVRTAELIAERRSGLGPVEAPHIDQRARGDRIAGIPVHSLRLQGVVARQSVILGGVGETLTVTHDTLDSTAYERGIMIALDAARSASGITVGLDQIIDLGIARP
ncbi:4-hydroxy-tetrahydrodipicolinate reductase [Okibacterium endophyticum]